MRVAVRAAVWAWSHRDCTQPCRLHRCRPTQWWPTQLPSQLHVCPSASSCCNQACMFFVIRHRTSSSSCATLSMSLKRLEWPPNAVAAAAAPRVPAAADIVAVHTDTGLLVDTSSSSSQNSWCRSCERLRCPWRLPKPCLPRWEGLLLLASGDVGQPLLRLQASMTSL